MCEAIRGDGYAVDVCDHRPERARELADFVFRLVRNRLVETSRRDSVRGGGHVAKGTDDAPDGHARGDAEHGQRPDEHDDSDDHRQELQPARDRERRIGLRLRASRSGVEGVAEFLV